MKEYIHDIIMRSLKIIDIGYIACIYFILGILLARLFDRINGKFDKKKEQKRSFFTRTVDIVLMFWVFGIVIYLVRNVVELIPSPFDNIYGYDHLRVKELKDATVFSFIFLYYQNYFKDKIQYYYDNLDPSLW